METVLEEIIEISLRRTREHCDFKKAWIPKGWACVPINRFAKELAIEIRKRLKTV
jgi:hypothetical protein